jgi:hypothetical protein
MYLLRLLAITALACLFAGLSLPWVAPMPGYFVDVKVWAASGHIADTFTPLAYPLFLGSVYRLAGVPGCIVLQGVLQVGIAAVCFLFLRMLGVSPLWSMLGSLPVGLHPDLLSSVCKGWDVGLATFLFLLLVVLAFEVSRAGLPSLVWLSAGLGVVSGAAIFCRPNYAFLLPVVFVEFWKRRSSVPLGSLCRAIAISTGLGCATFALLGVASHGSVFFPRNGPYNLYAGHNPRTLSMLLTRLNAETSLVETYFEAHPGNDLTVLYDPQLGPYYVRQTILFAREHPGTELALIPAKLFTLFRPDTRNHALLSLDGIAKCITALPVFLVAGMLILARRGRTLQAYDMFLMAIEVAYILPFLITNSDPRFRIPLDVLLIVHFTSLLYRRLYPRPVGVEGTQELAAIRT